MGMYRVEGSRFPKSSGMVALNPTPPKMQRLPGSLLLPAGDCGRAHRRAKTYTATGSDTVDGKIRCMTLDILYRHIYIYIDHARFGSSRVTIF